MISPLLAFAARPDAVPPLIVKLGGGIADDVRETIAANVAPLGIDRVAIGQLSPVGEFADDLAGGGPILADLRRIGVPVRNVSPAANGGDHIRSK